MPEHKPEYNEAQIGEILQRLSEDYAPHNARLRVRRHLMEMGSDAVGAPGTGTELPEPHKNSALILKTLIGDPIKAAQNYTQRVAANEPQVEVIPVAGTGSEVGKRVAERAADQERLLMSMYEAVGGREAQQQVAWSQSWGRAGWYFTLPREAEWGLPSREYYEDLTDDEAEAMKRSGKIAPDFEELANGQRKYRETAGNWLERRKQQAQENAINSRSFATLEAIPPDMVMVRYDRDGTARKSIKYAAIVAELPREDFNTGGELAEAATRYQARYGDEISQADMAKYGISLSGGVNKGGEPGSVYGERWYLTIFLTRDEAYWYVSETPGQGGTIIHHQWHGGAKVPLIPVPGFYTDSMKPGNEYSSLMEDVFSLTPIINQIETLLSNVATWNALARFVIILPDGTVQEDDDGNPLIVSSEDLLGGDPASVQLIKGEPRQLEIKADMLLLLLEFYTARLDGSKPSPVTEGEAGKSQAAWAVRMSLEAANSQLGQAVDNNAAALKQVFLLWIRWLRLYDEAVYSFAAPGNRGSDKSVRGLIEFQPKDLVETITVQQSSQSAEQRVVLQQQGVELRRENVIDDLEMYTEYFLKADPEEAEIRGIAAEIEQLVWRGASETIAPESLLWDASLALRGQISHRLLTESPAFAMATAEDMAIQTAMASQPTGNVAQAAGAVEPGVGMSTTQPALPPPPQTAGVAP